jgi:hypothetical protein
MNKSIREIMSVLSVVTPFVGVMLFGTSQGWAQQKAGPSAKQLVGTWTLVSQSTILPDGKKVQAFGPNPQGLLIFDANGEEKWRRGLLNASGLYAVYSYSIRAAAPIRAP